jgi:hypothetical protein
MKKREGRRKAEGGPRVGRGWAEGGPRLTGNESCKQELANSAKMQRIRDLWWDIPVGLCSFGSFILNKLFFSYVLLISTFFK